jgi:hypothetical protein
VTRAELVGGALALAANGDVANVTTTPAGVGPWDGAAWWVTFSISRSAFDPHPIQALSFTGPSAEVLTRTLFATDKPLNFDLGLMPGVFLGSFVAAWLFKELKLEGFAGGAPMRRALIGAACMGFGGMLAGGCAVGAGLSGAAVFTMTSWVSLTAMWAAAALTDRLVDQRPQPAAPLDEAMPGRPAPAHP